VRELGKQHRQQDHDDERHQHESEHGRRRAERTVEPSSDDNREIDDVRPGQKLRERQCLGELPLGYPPVVLDKRAVRERHDAAESRDADLEEFPEQRAGGDAAGCRWLIDHHPV